MHSFIPALFIATIAATNAAVIIGPQTYNRPSVPSRSPYLPPVYKYNAPVVTKTIYSSPVKSVHTDEQIIKGPSGTIQTKKTLSKPGIITYPAKTVIHTPVVSYASPVVTSHKIISPSYYGSHKRVELVPSPYGLVPAGSGLEGQYVPDNREQLYDDGSYRREHH